MKIAVNYGVRLPAKLRRMSKRRQKIAIKRRINREVMSFVGREYSYEMRDELYERIHSYLKECLLKPVVYEYRLDVPIQSVSVACKVEE